MNVSFTCRMVGTSSGGRVSGGSSGIDLFEIQNDILKFVDWRCGFGRDRRPAPARVKIDSLASGLNLTFDPYHSPDGCDAAVCGQGREWIANGGQPTPGARETESQDAQCRTCGQQTADTGRECFQSVSLKNASFEQKAVRACGTESSPGPASALRQAQQASRIESVYQLNSHHVVTRFQRRDGSIELVGTFHK